MYEVVSDAGKRGYKKTDTLTYNKFVFYRLDSIKVLYAVDIYCNVTIYIQFNRVVLIVVIGCSDVTAIVFSHPT